MVSLSISIDVPEVAKAMDFYVNALACDVVRDKTPKSAVLSAGGTDIHLLVNESGSNPIPDQTTKRTYQRHWTPIHLDFLLADVQGAVARVVEFGGSHEGGEQADWGEIAYCADPFGNGFCLIRE